LRSAKTELDRTVTRIRARDAGAVLRAVKRQRPDARSVERRWAGIVAVLGLPVELACRQRPADAQTLRAGFLRRWPDRSLEARLASACPQ